jgi:hypothetical protein
MMLIKPSSVDITGAGSSATINDSGSVTFSACATLSLNDVFSSTYDNYVIDIRHTGTGAAELNARLRTAGSDASGSNYTWQQLVANGSSVSGSRQTPTSIRIGTVNSPQRCGDTVYVYGPNLGQPTAFRNVSITSNAGATIADHAGTHSLSTSYAGLTLIPSSGTFSGLIKVYGLRQ